MTSKSKFTNKSIPDYGQAQVVLINLLRKIRKEAGLSQQELATRVSKPQSFVSKYESGERRLDILELYYVCRALDVQMTDFVQWLEAALSETE